MILEHFIICQGQENKSVTFCIMPKAALNCYNFSNIIQVNSCNKQTNAKCQRNIFILRLERTYVARRTCLENSLKSTSFTSSTSFSIQSSLFERTQYPCPYLAQCSVKMSLKRNTIAVLFCSFMKSTWGALGWTFL